MRRSVGRIRNVLYLMITLMLSAALAACGGSGGGSTSSTSPGVSGPATVGVSIASAPSYPAGTTFATSTSSPATAAAPANSPEFTNVFVTVTKLALIPSSGSEFPDPNGEPESSSSGGDNGFVTETFSPVTFDLLHPNSSTGDNVATLLNKFTGVPAGEYSKIRVYYDTVVGQPGDTSFHPTANYHFDVHFVGGNLVIPFTSDSEGGIRFYSVQINVVGLKYHEAGQSGNILLRPQVFAEVVGAPEYIVTGVAEQVNHFSGTFNVITAGNDNISAAYGSETKWWYVDGRYVGPFGISGADALWDTALVDVIGTFQSGVLTATRVNITFPWVLSDNVYLGWTGDNTIVLRFTGDNVVSVPNALQNAVYYDNAAYPYGHLTELAIVDNVFITARGYATGLGIKAYWISIGDIVIGP